MAFPWLAVGLAVASVVVSLLLMPKAKTPKPDALTDLEAPTAEAGRPFPVVFGTITVKGLNNLWYGDKGIRSYTTSA